MRYRRLDENGDYSFGRGGGDFLVDTPAAVAQAVSTRLRLWYGEWFLDTADGMPWSERVLGAHTRLRDAAIRRRVLNTPGVRKLNSYTSQVDGESRRFSVQMEIETAYGAATLTGMSSRNGELSSFTLSVR